MTEFLCSLKIPFIPIKFKGGIWQLLAIAVITFLISACKKTEEVIIPGNKPPPDTTQPAAIRNNFISKSYIGLLGREPRDVEFLAAQDLIAAGNFNIDSRSQVLESILSQPDFYSREFELANNELLNGADTFQVNDIYNTFQYLLTQPDYEYAWSALQMEMGRLLALKNAIPNLKNGSITIKEMQRICCDNYFYDQINMGSLNFVIATFQHLLLRNPTEYEATEGVKIVDGFSGILFMHSAETKAEFLEVFFQSDGYYEGQARLLFNRFLFRNPTSEESSFYTALYKTSGNYKLLVKKILSSNEFAGLD